MQFQTRKTNNILLCYQKNLIIRTDGDITTSVSFQIFVMSSRKDWLLGVSLIFLISFILSSVLLYRRQTRQQSSVPFEFVLANRSIPLASWNQSRWHRPEQFSFFEKRIHRRLLHLGQRFAHIRLDRLLEIQQTSRQALIYSCWKNCGGWGDRLRGITSIYILAVLLQRRFLIDMSYPCNLSHFLESNLIDWQRPKRSDMKQEKSLRLDPMHQGYAKELYANISSTDLSSLWAHEEIIYLTSNHDYITPALKNPFFQSMKSQLNIRSNESTQAALFPLIFELLFHPTGIVIDQLDRLLQRTSTQSNASILCMHVRLGQNPTVPQDSKLHFRDSMVTDMIDFIDRNLSRLHPWIFVTSDSYRSQRQIGQHYPSGRVLTVPGPIIHVDRLNSRSESNETLYRGFLKVIADFYFLGECDLLLKPRSGFSEWANHRRLNEYANLFIYCRGLHRVTSEKWRRPHTLCWLENQ